MSGLTREELAERICTTPELVPLLTRVLHEVGMTGQVEVLDALGAALGDAIREPSRSDEVELVLIGLESVRKQHIRVLALLREAPEPSAPNSATATDPEPLWMRAADVAARGVATEESAAALLTGLANAGFAREAGAAWDSGVSYRITPLGETLLDVLDQLRA